MRVCVYGAGAVGGHIAARLARGGAQVSVIARGPNLAAMAANGLEIRSPGDDFRAALTATDDPAALGRQDAVIVAVKAPSLPAVAAGITPLLAPDTPVIFAMNGIPWWYFHGVGGALEGRRLPRIDPDDAMWNAVGPARAVGCVVYSGCTVIEPGVVATTSYRNRLVLGAPDGSTPARVQEVARIITAGGMTTDVTPRIRDTVWSKLVNNLSSGPMGVLTQSPSNALFPDPAVRLAVHQIGAEIAAVAAAMGCPIDPDPAAQIAGASKSQHVSSIVQDLTLGRPMEIDAIFRAPLELARLVGVATPILDLLVALATARARAAGLYVD